MLSFVGRRIAVAVPTMLLISVFAFALIHIAPGNPALVLVPPQEATPAVLRAVEKQYHLGDPLPVQYWAWVKKVADGDLGTSLAANVPVGRLVFSALPTTLELTAAALLLAGVLGVLLGVLAATGPPFVDWLVRTVNLLEASVPSFVFGILFVLVFGYYLAGAISYDGWVTLGTSVSGNLEHVLLPAVALALGPMGLIARLCRGAMLDVLGREYIEMARALGVRERTIIWRDALKNALLPVLTALGLIAAYLLSGAVVIETIFDIPGIGQLVVNALNERDYPLVSGTVLVLSGLVLVINLVIDVVSGFVSPRLARSQAGGR